MSMYLNNKSISIVGGGLVGSLLSIYLKKQGAKVSVFDKRMDLRVKSFSGTRSINLALSNRGIQALQKIGIKNSIMEIAMPMYKRIIHAINGDLTEQSYGKKNQAIYSISRKSLNTKLIDLAEDNKVDFYFNQKCVGVDFINTELSFQNTSSKRYDYIFGSDGYGSVVRKCIKKEKYDINVSEEQIGYGYKELTINACQDGAHQLANDALHIWPRKSFMLIALPNLDGTFTCTLFAPLKGENSFDSLTNKIDVKNFFMNYFYDLTELVPDITDQFFNNPLSSLGFVRCSSWKCYNTFLIGDACHATVPFYGQGMNAGFEDCYLLNDWINQNKSMDNHSIGQFLQQRIIDTTAMQDLSMSNFVEMRDKTANPNFLLQKKIEDWFSEKHPDKWIPLYSMVTFSHMGYHQAMLKGELQDVIMNDIMIKNNLFDDFDINDLENKKIEQQILYRINKL